jgi:hypothetical protein
MLPAPGEPLCISFLGFNPLGDGFDGRGLVDAGAHHTFSSLDTLGANRLLRRHFGKSALAAGTTSRPRFDLRITGYSFGGWSALQLAHSLGSRFRVRLGLIDPVCTFRVRRLWKLTPWPGIGIVYAGKPANAELAVNVFQTKGLIARLNHGAGARLPYPANWFASQAISGFENIDKSDEVSFEAGHVEIAERYGRAVAHRTFQAELVE